tara:strand:- start:407 stop:598 length:192 start_codon:yes stop_codon:yes gene_type:complete
MYLPSPTAVVQVDTKAKKRKAAAGEEEWQEEKGGERKRKRRRDMKKMRKRYLCGLETHGDTEK